MADFKTRIDDLTGFASTDDTALSDWLSAGARSVMNVLPLNKLERVASNENFTNNIDVEGKKILSVVRKDNNHASKIYTPCRKLPPSMMGRVNDTNYMEAASESDPAYIIQNDVLNTYPGSNASNDSRVVFVNSSITVAHGDSAIANFPDEAEEAVVLYGARNALNRLMNAMNTISALSISSSAPSTPDAPSISYSDASVGSSVSSAQDAVATAQDSIATAQDSIAAAQDGYTGETSVSPGSASGSTDSAYSKVTPTTSNSGSLTTLTAGAKGTADDQIDSDKFFDVAADLIESDEDVELATAQIAKINSYVNAFKTEVENEKAAMTATIKDAELATQASIASARETTRANTAIASSKTTAGTAKMQASTSAATAKMQASTSAATAKMQASTGAAVQKMQLSTNAAIELMRQATSVSVQNEARTLEAAIQDYVQEISRFQVDIGKFSANVNKEVQQYNSNLQKDIAKYSWYEKQYAMIDARYKEQIQTLQGAI